MPRLGPKQSISASSASGVFTLKEAQQETGNDTWPAVSVGVSADYLVVAGGGSGGGRKAGGGGAGGYRYFTSQSLVAGTTYTVTVGAGGASYSGSDNTQGNDGNTSTFNSISSTGGGGGGAQAADAHFEGALQAANGSLYRHK